MRDLILALGLAFLVTPVPAQEPTPGPTSEKAQKTYKEGIAYLQRRLTDAALDDFKKADKQDDYHCRACQKMMLKCAMELGDWKVAEQAASEMAEQAGGGKNSAIGHYNLGMVLMNEAMARRQEKLFSRIHEEMGKALAAYAEFPSAVFVDGEALAHLNQDDAAKAQFEKFLKMIPQDDPNRQRALRYINDPALARARMAPAFAVTTLDGQHVSLDDLKGKVVLLDFWATWCGPCREALPHMQQMAKKFEGQPLVILSVSLDNDESKWKEFIAKNQMTWLQYRDGSFKGAISTLFGVEAIPQTFTIDPDGVLQDQHIGDASIEGKLKKLIARANELQAGKRVQ